MNIGKCQNIAFYVLHCAEMVKPLGGGFPMQGGFPVLFLLRSFKYLGILEMPSIFFLILLKERMNIFTNILLLFIMTL